MILVNKVALIVLLFPFASTAVLDDYSKVESDCRKEITELNNSVVMGCAELASTVAKKDMNISRVNELNDMLEQIQN